MRDPLVYIIVLNWNGMEHLETCFRSLMNLTYRNYKIVLVDNGSSDESVGYIKKNFPLTIIVQNKRNIGFCRGNNLGIQLAIDSGAKYIALLNNDTEVECGWLTELVKACEDDPDIGVCSSKMLLYDYRTIINSTGVNCAITGIPWDRGGGRLDTPRWNTSCNVLSACGGAFFARVETLKKTGLFPRHFFIYYEDLDLCLRVWSYGYKCRYIPKAVVYHKYDATMGSPSQRNRKTFLSIRNRYLLIARNFPLTRKVITKNIGLFINGCKEAIGTNSINRLLIEIKSLGSACLYMPDSLYRRLRTAIETKKCYAFWEMINKHDQHQAVIIPERARCCGDGRFPSRVIMGVNDHTSLYGSGWYPLQRGDIHRRYICKKAQLSLKAEAKNCVLQIQIANPFSNIKSVYLGIYINKDKIADFEPAQEMTTYNFAIDMDKDIAEVTFEASDIYEAENTGRLTDTSFDFAEISLLPSTSPLLRTGLPGLSNAGL